MENLKELVMDEGGVATCRSFDAALLESFLEEQRPSLACQVFVGGFLADGSRVAALLSKRGAERLRHEADRSWTHVYAVGPTPSSIVAAIPSLPSLLHSCPLIKCASIAPKVAPPSTKPTEPTAPSKPTPPTKPTTPSTKPTPKPPPSSSKPFFQKQIQPPKQPPQTTTEKSVHTNRKRIRPMQEDSSSGGEDELERISDPSEDERDIVPPTPEPQERPPHSKVIMKRVKTDRVFMGDDEYLHTVKTVTDTRTRLSDDEEALQKLNGDSKVERKSTNGDIKSPPETSKSTKKPPNKDKKKETGKQSDIKSFFTRKT